jgi:EpsI family protein
MSLVRVTFTAFILAAGILMTRSIKAAPAPEEHRALRDFPAAFAGWHGQNLLFDDGTEDLGVDDFTNREYFGGDRPIELYIGYYKDQRSGDAIHSPKNCLPGSGWEPVRSTRLQIGTAENPATVNEYIVEQGAQRDLVLYWYQTHGRIVASEYAAKFWLIADGVRGRPTDGAMIRIWTSAGDGEQRAESRAAEFARQVYPEVTNFLPH